jgi:beta-lactam-binding protein with PASTA domain/tRNA A-37 threonylcarbamoyl transferase component Bud32
MAQPTPLDGSRGHALVTLDGRYHVVERIASGGMGEVYLARDAVLDREVAIKVLHRSLSGDQAFIDRFRREARAAAGLSHPNIVAVFDWGSVDGIYYMVMEYVRGRASRALLNQYGRLEPAQAVDVVRQTLRGLEHAHHQGIVHRDIKPENVLVTTEGVVKVADFGLARAFADGRQTQAGSVTGTVQYLAPEQIRGEPADPRSDLYSLGIVTYELLTGKLPFTGETAMSIAYKHLSGRVPKPSAAVDSIPAELDGFVASATDRDRELRPESATAMRQDIDAIAPALPPARALTAIIDHDVLVEEDTVVPTGVVALPDPDPEVATTTRTIRTSRRRWRRVAGTVALIVAAAAAAWGVWTYAIPHSAKVPALAGDTVAEARTQLADLGFAVRIAQGQFSEDVPDGRVLKVQPVPGTSLREGETVTIVPSLGPPPVKVPSIESKTVERAREMLREAGLVLGERRLRYSDTVPEGSIISAPSGTRPQGSEIDVVVSQGHAPVAISKVSGRTQDEATATLRDAGFVVVTETDFSTSIDRGSVIAVHPKAGSVQPYASTVTLVISLGPERFPAPSLIGMSRSEADAVAGDLGLNLSVIVLPNTSGSTVATQNPAPGVTVSYGDTILVYLL